MKIERHITTDRLSQALVYNGIAYLTGQVANDEDASVAVQTQQVLDKIDKLLSMCGTDKSKILSAQVWVSDIKHFEEMNNVWEKWTAKGAAPSRATVEAKLARPGLKVEIKAVAAV